jgi:hypothetical protein
MPESNPVLNIAFPHHLNKKFHANRIQEVYPIAPKNQMKSISVKPALLGQPTDQKVIDHKSSLCAAKQWIKNLSP